MVNTDPKHGYRPDIDGLRAVAVLSVMLFHFDRGLLPSGYLGVDIFFVISGYVITLALGRLDRSTLRGFLANFYANRVRRIVPALALCLVVTWLVTCLVVPSGAPDFRRFWQTGVAAAFGVSNIFLSAQASSYFGASAELNPFTHTWSLGVEEQFYFLYPVLFWAAGAATGEAKRRRVALAVLALASISSFALFALVPTDNTAAAYYLTHYRLWELGLGCITAFLVRDGERLERLPNTVLSLTAMAVLLGVFWVPTSYQSVATPIACLMAAVLIGTGPRTAVGQLLALPLPVLLGRMSYSLYLWHWSVLAISRWTIGVSAGTALAQVPLIFVLSALSYSFVEVPLRRRAWSSSRERTVAIGLAVTSAAAVFLMTLGGPLKGRLYAGNAPPIGERSLVAPKSIAGVRWDPESCVITGKNDIGKKISTDDCTIPGPAGRQFLVLGNSHALAEFGMYSGLSELGTLKIAAGFGAAPIPGSTAGVGFAKSSDYFWSDVVPDFVAGLKPGDFVLLISDLADILPSEDGLANEPLPQFAKALQRWIADLHRKNVDVVIQTALPFIRDAGCAPESAMPQWFTLEASKLCKYYSREATQKRREPLDRVLRDLESKYPNFAVLDLLPVYCPGATCGHWGDDGTFLYRDKAHPSVAASARSAPILRELIERRLAQRANPGEALDAKQAAPELDQTSR